MRIFCLSPADVSTETIWGDVLPHIERFCAARGEGPPEYIRRRAMDSTVQLWGLQDAECVHAVVVTEIKATPHGQRCEIWIAQGGAPVPIQERLLEARNWD